MHQFSPLNLPSSDHIPLVLSALQHIPFRIDGSGSLLPSLIILPQNNQYWQALGVATKRTRQWTIPVVMNIIWVLISSLLSIVDSFVGFSHFITIPGDAGYSTAAVWTYLLPLVVGWLHVGSQPEANHLSKALNEAHATVHVATAEGPVLATEVTCRPTYAIEHSTKHINSSNADEKRTAPIFNYSRVFIWSQSAEYILSLSRHAATKAARGVTVGHGGEWKIDASGAIAASNWIGNETEVVQYCTGHRVPTNPNPRDPQSHIPPALYSTFPPSSGSSAMTSPTAATYSDSDALAQEQLLAQPLEEDEEASLRWARALPEKPVFATGVFRRVAHAASLGLGLQWGTTGASIFIHNTPQKGMNCRTLTFAIYGATATASFLLLLLSSILSHLARRQDVHERRSSSKKLIGCVTALTTWLGKVIAVMNGFGILLSCVMQFAGVYDSCFCSSDVFSGDPNGLVFIEEAFKGSEVYGRWVGGIIMAFGASALYALVIHAAAPTTRE